MSVILVVRMGINEVNLKETWEFPGSFLGKFCEFLERKVQNFEIFKGRKVVENQFCRTAKIFGEI